MKGVMHFSSTGKLAPRFVGPFPIIERIGPVAYRVSLPQHLSGIHDVFHVSQLRKCIRDSDIIIDPSEQLHLEISPSLSTVQQPIRVLDSEVRRLRSKNVPLGKIQWSENPKDCTWETRESIERSFPGFLSTSNSGENLISQPISFLF